MRKVHRDIITFAGISFQIVAARTTHYDKLATS